MRHLLESYTHETSLNARLANATKDEYQRSTRKEARYKPDLKDKPTNRKPIVKMATAKQKKAYYALQNAS